MKIFAMQIPANSDVVTSRFLRVLVGILSPIGFLTILFLSTLAFAQTSPVIPANPTSPTLDGGITSNSVVDNATVYSTAVPATMQAGSVYSVAVTMQNGGLNAWSADAAKPYRLGSDNPADNVTWGLNRVSMRSGVIAQQGDIYAFEFQVTAPTTPGTYTFRWGMLTEGGSRFGTETNINVTVTAPAPVYNAQITSKTIPTTMAPGTNNSVSVTLKNTGNVTWVKASGYRLGATSPVDNKTWGTGRAEMSDATVLPGASTTVSFVATAPTTPGNYLFDWGMLWEGNFWFGATTNTTVAVNAKPTISVSRPALVVGQAITMTWSTTGATALTHVCTTSGTGYSVNESLAVSGSRSITPLTTWVGYPSSCTWTASGAGGTATYTETMSTTAAASTQKPTISVTRPSLVVGQVVTMTWSATDATSLTHLCTATGTGYAVNETLAVSGSRSITPLTTWVGYPSSCTWTATGAGGTATYTETMTTTTATGKPTITVLRPALVVGQAVTMTWSTTNATSMTHVCTASGMGYAVNESVAVSGSRSITPLAGWVSYPSACTWTATGTAGTTTYSDSMTTTQPAAGGVTYIHTDGLGSPVARTDATGNLVSRTAYEPYGYVASGAVPTIGFAGQFNDADTGLTYMEQRYYDPVAGRFLSIDPVTTDTSNGNGFNRYAYVLNNPFKYVDPDGRATCEQLASMCQNIGAPAGNSGGQGHYNDYLKSGAAYGDGPSTVAAGYDDWALGKGYMTRGEWTERAEARGIGAGIGFGVVAGGAAAFEARFIGAALIDGFKQLLGFGRGEIQFGNNPNQLFHAFRHIEEAGLDRAAVEKAVRQDLSKSGGAVSKGQISGSVTVNGIRVDYSAFKLENGTINVGRITPPRQ